jgi:myo-inositol-1(or 4)-monophosphatase
MKALTQIAAVSRAIRRTGSAALDLCYVATGQFDGFWEWGLSTWDVAAGMALLHEAGGKLTQITGEPYHLGDSGILATNGFTHEEMQRLLSV